MLQELKSFSVLNPLNAELNPICHSLILLGHLKFMDTCIVSIFQYISNKMQRYTFYLYLETALHVFFFTLDAGLLTRSQYPEGSATGQLDTGFSWFPCVYKQMLRWFPSFQAASACFSCSPPD
jgi:hypothetical protein